MSEKTNLNSLATENSIKTSISFMNAIENNDLKTLNKILENEKICSETFYAGLMKSLILYRNNPDTIEIIDSLLNKIVDLNIYLKPNNTDIQIKDKVTILMYACHNQYLKLVDKILKYNPDVNLTDSNNRNSLFYAINTDKGDKGEIVTLLIKFGINVNDPEKENKVTGHSALTLATQKNMSNTVKILLDNGANANWKVSKDENTALHYAVNNCNKEIIKNLLSKNANLKSINKNDLTPLSLALKLSHTDIYKLLCEEHNKILNREKEIANEVMAEDGKKLNKNFSDDLLINKIKKNSEEGLRETNKEESGFRHEEIRDEKNEVLHNVISNKNPSFSINIITPSNDVYHNQQYNSSETNANKKKNKKSEFISKKKENEQTINLNTNNKINIQNNKTDFNTSSQIEDYSKNCRIEIPIEFQKKIGNTNQFNSYIRIKSNPILFLDYSNKTKEETSILNYKLNELKADVINKNNIVKLLEENLGNLNEEVQRLKKENISSIDTINNKEKYINELHLQWKIKEEQYLRKIDDLQEKLENSISFHKELTIKYDMIERDIVQITAKNNFDNLNNHKIKELSIKKDFLEKKFSTLKYEDKYIIKCLQKDILDFQEHTKDQMNKNKASTDELLRFVQEAVSECIPDYEVKLYGSHATSLCLHWSDLDIVLVNKRTHNSSNYGVLQSLYLNMYDKPWKRSIKFIDTAVIPIIKLIASEEFSSLQIDISLQDGKHYGLKCVELVKSFMNEYEALEPLIFALKNLLKNANLNDPYTGGLSSYGLILMVVSYLQSQLEGNKPIKISEGNIGRLFLEFLCYYGLIFDHTKYVIYTYPPADLNYVDKDNNNFFFNMQSGHELIIVDPLNKSNNVARSTYQFANIKMAFMIGFVVSREECECSCHFTYSNESFVISNTDHCILKRIFNSVKRFNANANN